MELGRLSLPLAVDVWLAQALVEPGIRLLALTPQIAVESTRLVPPFQRDPADQIIVATARVHACALVTLNGRIRAYPHVQLLP